MTYDTIEIIPAKLFFKIVETGNLALLSDSETDMEKLEGVWAKMEEEHAKLDPNGESSKTLSIYKKIESLSARYNAIRLMVHYLKAKRDNELESILKGYGYSFSGDFKKDLEKVERESKAIQVKIKRIENQLPKRKKEDEGKELGFDESVMTYCSFVQTGFIDTNKITLTQYYALINIGNQKIKALEDGKAARKNNKG